MSALDRVLESLYRQVSDRFGSEAQARAWVARARRELIDPCVEEAVIAERRRCAAIARGFARSSKRVKHTGRTGHLLSDARVALAIEIEGAILDGANCSSEQAVPS